MIGNTWTNTLPTVLAEAIITTTTIASIRLPRSDQEFLGWVEAGLPEGWTWCDYDIARGHSTGQMHRFRIVGPAVQLADHDVTRRSADLAAADAAGRHLACYATVDALDSVGPMTGANAQARRIGRDQAKRLRTLRIIWLAYRWMRAGRDVRTLDEVTLTRGPGPSTGRAWNVPGATSPMPPVLAEAVAAWMSGSRAATAEQFADLVEEGVFQFRIRCGYPYDGKAADGVMHQIGVVGDRLVLAHHEEADRVRDLAEAQEQQRLPVCHLLAEMIGGTEPLTRSGRVAAGYANEQVPAAILSSAQARRAEQLRTVWLAYRWLRHGHRLSDVEPFLATGPGPAEATEWLDAGVPAERVVAWYGRAGLDACLRWQQSPQVGADAATVLDTARATGFWDAAAQLALLGSTDLEPPSRWMDEGEDELAVWMLLDDITGQVGVATEALRNLLRRNWVRVTTQDDCRTYRAAMTAYGARRMAIAWGSAYGQRFTDRPELTRIREPFRDYWRIAEMAKMLRPTGVQRITVTANGRVMLTNEFDGTTDLADVEQLGLQRENACRERFGDDKHDTIVRNTSALSARHGVPLTIDLRRMVPTGPHAPLTTVATHWFDTLPAVLADAIAAVQPGMQPASATEFHHWVDNGLRPLIVHCDGPHRLVIAGDQVTVADHDPQTREQDEFMAALSGEPLACYGIAEALTGFGPITRLPDGYDSRSVERVEAYRTVWLAHRWMRAGRLIDQVVALLTQGPSPEQAGDWLAAGVPPERVADWYDRHDLAACLRWNAWPQVSADDAVQLDRFGVGPDEVARWEEHGMPAEQLAGWLTQMRDRNMSREDVLGWSAAGVTGEQYLRHGLAGMSLPRFRRWQATGLPVRHIRAYEDAHVQPSMIHGLGTALGLASEPVQWVIRRLGGRPGPHTRTHAEYCAQDLLHYSKSW
ncbi:hypothetical protein [Actinoplanes sp. HUAS TT8]|uniref:hypothetical protein n=1 Tax=Actinoplanes sp. HUAS TT8 TaxID=3447453 RepID=UPI003F523420